MQKIKTKEESEKEGRRNKIIISLILVFIMVLSTIGYAFFNQRQEEVQEEGKITYKGLVFSEDVNGFWSTQINEYGIITKYNPEETKNVSFFDFDVSVKDFYNHPLYFVSNNTLAVNELSRNICLFSTRCQAACLEETCGKDFPVKNCTENIIIIKDSDVFKSSKKDNCLFIEAPKEEQERVADSLVFKILSLYNLKPNFNF